MTVDKLDPELKPLTEQFLELRRAVGGFRDFEIDYGQDDWDDDFEEGDPETDDGDEKLNLTEADIEKFEGLWTDAVDQEDKRASILSFALSGLSAGASPTAEQYILDNLETFPHLASVAARYLKSLGFKADTAERIVSFLTSESCLHEWQKIWLLEYFRQPSANIRSYLPRLQTLLDNANQHPLVRGLTAELIAMKGSEADGEHIKSAFTSEADQRIRRQLLLGYRQLPITERNHAISYLPRNEWLLELVGRLVTSRDDSVWSQLEN